MGKDSIESLFPRSHWSTLRNLRNRIGPFGGALRIEERPLGEVPGPVSRQISAPMDSIITGKDQRFLHWLYPME
jgi:hypothetical protein